MADDNDLEKSAQALREEVKGAIASIFDREVTPQEFYYLLSRYPYLELCDTDYPYIDKGTKPEIIVADTGWHIYNYGTVVAAGCHELIAMMLSKEKREEDGDEGGSGTIVQQYSDTALEMMALAKKLGWRLAEVVAGFYPMQRMAWIGGELLEYPLKGFNPTREDYVVLRWVSQLKQGQLYPPMQEIPGFGPKKSR